MRCLSALFRYIKFIAILGAPLRGRLFYFDAFSYAGRIFRFSSLDAEKHEQVRAAGDKWLNDLSAERKAQVLGRVGAEAWEDGADWRKYMRGFSGFRKAESRLKNISGKGIIEATKILEGHNSLPKKSQPNDIIDHVDKNGAIKTRAFYDATGFKYKEIHTTNHGKPKAHYFGVHGEHGHDYEWGLDGKLKNKTRRELTDQERKENQNII